MASTKAITILSLLASAFASPFHVKRQSNSTSPTTNTTSPEINYVERNRATIQAIYDNAQYPNNQVFMQKGYAAIPSGLFNQNVQGRIAPIGNFSGIQAAAEYFYGLTPPPDLPLYTTWTNAQMVSFSSGCPNVASSVVWSAVTGVNASFPQTYQQQVTTIKQVAFWRFDDDGAVIAYDAVIPNLAAYTIAQQGGPLDRAAETAQIGQFCGNTQALCKGPNQVYDSMDQCQSTMLAKPYGNWDEAWADNVICRTIHVLLAAINPGVHCQHLSANGGGKCVDIDYNDAYFDDELLFGQPVSDTFQCP